VQKSASKITTNGLLRNAGYLFLGDPVGDQQKYHALENGIAGI
jgi:hypothetical protein